MIEWAMSIWMTAGYWLMDQQKESEKPVETEEQQQEESEEGLMVYDKISGGEKEEKTTQDKGRGSDSSVDVGQTEWNYEANEGAEWWSPISGHNPISEVVQKGEEGQVTTVWGNGTRGQNETQLNMPRQLQLDSKGNLYFIDGDGQSGKIRMFDGKKNTTVLDLKENKVARQKGEFYVGGMVILNDVLYLASIDDLYVVEDGRLRTATPKVAQYLKKNRLDSIIQVEKYQDYIYFLIGNKSRQYHMARYNTVSGEMETVFDTKPIPEPYSFYVHQGNEIYIGTKNGYVVMEKLFPRQSLAVIETADPMTDISDVWIGEDDDLYYVSWRDQAEHIIYQDPKGPGSGVIPLIGSRRGFVDGFYNEVELDYPIDFIWDGSGFLFADMGNHTIRKYWTENGPMEP